MNIIVRFFGARKMIYLIYKNHRGFDWYTELYAVFEDKEKMLDYIESQVAADKNIFNDWLNGWTYTIYTFKDPLLEDKQEYKFIEDLMDKFPYIEDMLRYALKSERDSQDGIAHVGAMVLLGSAMVDILNKRMKNE